MFCPECGKPNADENKFCEYCSALLVENIAGDPIPTQETVPTQPAQEPSPQMDAQPVTGEKKDLVVNIPKVDPVRVTSFVKEKKFIIFPVLALLVAVIVFCAVGSSIASPERIAEKYFVALTENDFEAMYDCVAAPEGDFVSKEAYVEYMTNRFESSGNPYEGIENYKIREYRYQNSPGYDRLENEESGSSLTKAYVVDFVGEMTGYSDTYNIELVKQSDKTLLFFTNYKVALGGYVNQDVSIAVPNGFGAYVDGIELKDAATGESGLDIYKIDAIFSGNHKLTIKSEMIETYETDIYIDSDNDYIEISNYSNFKVSDAVLDTLEKKAITDLQKIYNSAIAGKASSQAGVKVSETYDYFYDAYEYICDHVVGYYDGTGLKSVKFKEYAMEESYSGGREYSLYNNEGFAVSFELEYNYSYTESVWDYFDDVNRTESSSDSDSTQFQYRWVDGEWVLSSLGYYTIDY